MIGTQIAKVSYPVFAGLAVVTAGVVIYALLRGYEVELKSPFFGEWKLKPRASNNSK